MKLHLSDLVLEVTRKCNMRCIHCLRGPAQRIDMDREVINRITAEVNWIASLTLSGGEPSIAGKLIDHLRWALYFNNCDLERFWLTINARFFKEDFYDAIQELYYRCSIQEECCLTISGDQYHGQMSRVAFERYSELPFFCTDRMRKIEDYQLLNEGMASKHQMGYRDARISDKIEGYTLDESTLYIDDLIYINAKGDVLLSCDLSYINQKKHSLGNVLHEPLADILMRNLAVRIRTESA